MQPDFTKLKPIAGQPNFATLKPVEIPTTIQQSSAPFKSVAGENPLIAGAKAVGNLPSSIYGLGKGLVQAVASPVETVKGIGGILGGAGTKVLEGTVGKLIGTQAKDETPQFDAFTNLLKERYGSLENLQRTATEDPFGFGADLLGVLEGGAGLAGKTAQLNRAIGTVGKTAITPVTKTISRGADIAGGTTKFGISQITGLKPETITKLVKEPEAFKNINPEIRVETANKVADVLDERLGELSDMGKGYQTIRESGGLVTIPPNTIRDILGKYGIKLDGANKIITSPESRPMSAGDRIALQDFIDNYGGVTTHTNNSFLNTREALSNLSKYDATKTTFSNNVARDLRQEFDKFGKAQIKGLKELDTAYAPERELLGQLKKDLIDSKTGELKDAAISKIANLTGKGKEQVLERVKQIIPDIEERVDLIKAVEDIENSMGLKVGTYARAGVGIGAAVTGNIPAVIAAIVAQPSIAVPLLKGAGYVGQKATPILRALRDIANDVNNFTIPASFKNKEGQLKLGMSIEDVSKIPSTMEVEFRKLAQENLGKRVGGAFSFDEAFANVKKDAQNYVDRALGNIAEGNRAKATIEELYGEALKFQKTQTVPSKITTNTKVEIPAGYQDRLKNLTDVMVLKKVKGSQLNPKAALEANAKELTEYVRGRKLNQTMDYQTNVPEKVFYDDFFRMKRDLIENTPLKDKLRSVLSTEAPKSKVFIDDTVKNAIKGEDAIHWDAPIKSYSSAERKLFEEKGGDISQIHDLARTSAIGNTAVARQNIVSKIQDLGDNLRLGGNILVGKLEQKPAQFAGYEGWLFKVKTPNGLVSEIQVISPEMTYGKALPEESLRVLGKQKIDEIRKASGVEPGIGHKIYEKLRKFESGEARASEEYKNLIKESENYYEKLRNVQK